MNNVLVIAYYFPPMGFSGVQRTLKFVKYLPEFGWRPTVLTVDPHAYFAFDDQLLGELDGRNVEIWRASPGGVFRLAQGRRTVALKNEGMRKLLNRVSQLFYIPDNKIGWMRNASAFLREQDCSKFNAVFSTAPPFSDHLLAVELKRQMGLPIALDFRDAWLDNPYHFYWTSWHRYRQRRLEELAVRNADAIITTNSFVQRGLLNRYASEEGDDRFKIITHGYDTDDFVHADTEGIPPKESDEIRFVYAGIFYEDHTPEDMFRALARIRSSHPDLYRRLRFYMVGYMQEGYIELAKQLDVFDRIVLVGYMPHRKTTGWLLSADVLWMVIGPKPANSTVSPGKAFEYIGSRKPILAILPENDIRTILGTFPNAWLVRPGDVETLTDTIVRIAEEHTAGRIPEPERELTEAYDRRTLTKHLAGILDEIRT